MGDRFFNMSQRMLNGTGEHVWIFPLPLLIGKFHSHVGDRNRPVTFQSGQGHHRRSERIAQFAEVNRLSLIHI